MNDIEKIISEARNYFDQSGLIEGSQFSADSPFKKFILKTAKYKQNKPDMNWVVTKVSIYDKKSNEIVYDLITDNDRFFHQWVVKDCLEYLVCSEVLCGGQTVINLTDKKIANYCTPDEGFIWADFFLSPSANKLAVIGCYWACPYEIKIYDFRSPLNLPLHEIETLELLKTDKDEIEWIDDSTFSILNYVGGSRVHSMSEIET